MWRCRRAGLVGFPLDEVKPINYIFVDFIKENPMSWVLIDDLKRAAWIIAIAVAAAMTLAIIIPGA